jgi:hypothetical protein
MASPPYPLNAPSGLGAHSGKLPTGATPNNFIQLSASLRPGTYSHRQTAQLSRLSRSSRNALYSQLHPDIHGKKILEFISLNKVDDLIAYITKYNINPNIYIRQPKMEYNISTHRLKKSPHYFSLLHYIVIMGSLQMFKAVLGLDGIDPNKSPYLTGPAQIMIGNRVIVRNIIDNILTSRRNDKISFLEEAFKAHAAVLGDHLIFAVNTKDVNILKIILENGGNEYINAILYDNKTVLDHADQQRSSREIKDLIRHNGGKKSSELSAAAGGGGRGRRRTITRRRRTMSRRL